MAVYRVRSFSRWARKQRLSDSALCDAVREMRRGVYEADLGGGLLKKRMPKGSAWKQNWECSVEWKRTSRSMKETPA